MAWFAPFWNRIPQYHLGHSLPLTSTKFAFNLWVNTGSEILMTPIAFFTMGTFAFFLIPFMILGQGKGRDGLWDSVGMAGWPLRLSVPVALIWMVFVFGLVTTTLYSMWLVTTELGQPVTNTEKLRQILLAIPICIAALGALIALPITLRRLQFTRRQTLAEE